MRHDVSRKIIMNSDSHCQLRVTVRISGSSQHDTELPAGARRFVVCAVDVCARAREYNTTPNIPGVTKFTIYDLT